MLSLTTYRFLIFAIDNGRDGTEMPALHETLSGDEIDGASAQPWIGWAVEKPILRSPPTTDNYVCNPDSPLAKFDLKDDLYVLSVDLLRH